MFLGIFARYVLECFRVDFLVVLFVEFCVVGQANMLDGDWSFSKKREMDRSSTFEKFEASNYMCKRRTNLIF